LEASWLDFYTALKSFLLVLHVEPVQVRRIEVNRSMSTLEGLDDVENILDAFRLDLQKLELLLISHAYLGDEIFQFLVLRQFFQDLVSIGSHGEAILEARDTLLVPLHKPFELPSAPFFHRSS